MTLSNVYGFRQLWLSNHIPLDILHSCIKSYTCGYSLVKRSFFFTYNHRHNVTKWDKNVSFSALIVSFEVWIFDVYIKASQKCVSHFRRRRKKKKKNQRKPSSTAIDTHKQIFNSFHRCRCRHHRHRQNII